MIATVVHPDDLTTRVREAKLSDASDQVDCFTSTTTWRRIGSLADVQAGPSLSATASPTSLLVSTGAGVGQINLQVQYVTGQLNASHSAGPFSIRSSWH